MTTPRKRKTKSHKPETRLLSDLTIHPFLKDSPMLNAEHPDFKNLVAAMESEGLDEHPIIINPANQIMDGRHRAMVARLLGWTQIPVIVRPEDKAEEIIFHALMARRHMHKWQIAYTLAPVIERHVEKGIQRRASNLIPGNKTGEKVNLSRNPRIAGFEKEKDGLTLFVEQSGIGEDVWRRVRELRARFDKRADWREQFEPRMFLVETDPKYISLEGAMKATGSLEAYDTRTPDLKAKRGEYDRLALEYMRKAGNQLEFWDKLGAPQRDKLTDQAIEAVRLWPVDLKKELAKALQDDLKRASK